MTIVAFFASCRCGQNSAVTPLEPADVVVSAERVAFPATWVGQRSRSTVVVTHRGGAPASLAVSLEAPFTTSLSLLSLVRGQQESLELDFAPTSAGAFTGVLRVGTLEVALEGVGVEVPECVSPAICVASRFDFGAGLCRQTAEPDGTSCETNCVSGGCVAGECIGGLKGCDDADACTLDACGEVSGCSHVARTCPAVNNPCQVATCDRASGCGTEPVPDGTLCGPDECKAIQVDVCIAGECVARPRPMTARCANRWVPTSVPGRVGHAMAYDPARRRVVLFGGGPGPLGDTWEWDGQRWLLRIPAASPPARVDHAMAWDPSRKRVVLFGGRDATDQPLNDTWEWDGSTWVERRPSTSPPARSEHAMVLDEARQRIVVISGRSSTGLLEDLWEWNGTSWSSRSLAHAPPARRGLAAAYDPDRQRIVIFGGAGEFGLLSDTWEWDGTAWFDRSTQQPIWIVPAPRVNSKLAYDLVRRRMLLLDGLRFDGVPATDVWDWDGTDWSPGIHRFPTGSAALAVDTDRQRVVIFSGSTTADWDGASWQFAANTVAPIAGRNSMVTDRNRQRVLLFQQRELWEWTGDSWTLRPPNLRRARIRSGMAWDAARQRLVLFGGFQDATPSDPSDIFDDTWEWDSTQWIALAPLSRPPGRGLHPMAFDSVRQEVLVVGGTDGPSWFSDTWGWNGTTWTLRSSIAPGMEDAALAYDEARQRAVLFGGATGETWTWDGQQWQQQHPLNAPSGRSRHSMAYDPSRQRVLLFGGFRAPDLFSDTWEWDGATWLQRSPLSSPPGSGDSSMAYEPVGERMMLQVNGVTWLFLP